MYKIIESKSQEWLENKISEMIKEGWQVKGGVSVTFLSRSGATGEPIYIFHQAMQLGIKVTYENH